LGRRRSISGQFCEKRVTLGVSVVGEVNEVETKNPMDKPLFIDTTDILKYLPGAGEPMFIHFEDGGLDC
jgi:hypothetical protein